MVRPAEDVPVQLTVAVTTLTLFLQAYRHHDLPPSRCTARLPRAWESNRKERTHHPAAARRCGLDASPNEPGPLSRSAPARSVPPLTSATRPSNRPHISAPSQLTGGCCDGAERRARRCGGGGGAP